MIVTKRLGAPTREAIAVAATASVGDTTAPSTNAASHDIPSMTACATTATTILATALCCCCGVGPAGGGFTTTFSPR